MEEREFLHHSLIKQPISGYQYIRKIDEQLYEKRRTIANQKNGQSSTPPAYVNFLKVYNEPPIGELSNVPYFLLKEGIYDRQWKAKRTLFEKIRSNFEENIIQQTIKSTQHCKNLTILNFNSEGFFQTLVILAKTLDTLKQRHRLPHHVKLLCIDPLYAPFVFNRQHFQLNTQIDSDRSTRIESTWIKKVYTQLFLDSNSGQKNRQKYIKERDNFFISCKEEAVLAEKRAQQCIYCIQKLFDIPLEIHLYMSADHFKKEYRGKLSQINLAINNGSDYLDFENVPSLDNDYIQMCETLFTFNQRLINGWLRYSSSRKKYELQFYHLETTR